MTSAHRSAPDVLRTRPSAVALLVIALLLLPALLLVHSSAHAQSNELRLPDRLLDAATAGSVTVLATLEHGVAGGIGGFSFGVRTELPVTVSDAQYLGPPADLIGVELIGANEVTVGAIFSFAAETIAAGTYDVLSITCDASGIVPGTTRVLEFRGDLGSPPIAIEYATFGGAVVPATVDGSITVLAPPPPSDIGPNLWVTHAQGGEVLRLDTVNEALVTSTPAPGGTGGSEAVAVTDAGAAWVADGTLGRLVRYAAVGNTTSSDLIVTVGGSPSEIAVDPAGNVWTVDGPAMIAIKVSPAGAVLLGPGGAVGPAVPLPGTPTAVAAGPLGFVWVLLDESVVKLTPSGSVALSIPLPSLPSSTGIAVDREGYVWVVLRALNQVRRFSSGGSLVGTWNLPVGFSPERIVIRRDSALPGQREAWVSPAPLFGGSGLQRLRFPVGTVDGFVTPNSTGLAIDGRGRIWLAEQLTDAIHRYDPVSGITDLILLGSATDARLVGDPTGYLRANVFFPAGDFDGDGSPNAVEIDAGTDPFSASSSPSLVIPNFVEPVVALACSVQDADVSLSWGMPTPAPDTFEVRRVDSLGGETVLAAALPAGTTSFADSGLAPGTVRYRVIARIGSDESAVRECVATIGPGQLVSSVSLLVADEPASLFDITHVEGADRNDPDVIAYYATDGGSDKIYALNGDYELRQLIQNPLEGIVTTVKGIAYDPDGDGLFGSILVAGGGDGEQVRVVEISRAGDEILGQWDVTVNTSPLLGEPGALAYSRDGQYLLFIGPVGCDIFALARASLGEVDGSLGFAHPEPSLAGFSLDGIDVPPGETFGAGGGTLALLSAETPSSPQVEQEYAVTSYAVTAVAGSPPTVVEVDSIALTVLEAENALGGFAFAEESLSVVGLTTENIHEILIETAPVFIRADCNNDGVTNIADPILHLGILFGGDPQTPCLDACDSNASGALDIADPITTLSFLFSSGAPPPAPFPGCGIDPAGGPLGCPVSPGCP